jgi:uncharacterized protein (DUF2126 family)/transglutaminase-like putative cysteine protease
VTIHVAIEHRTTYRFDRAITVGPHVVRLRPAPHCRTPILAYSLRIEPAGCFVNWQQDPFGNHVARLVFAEKRAELTVSVDLVADMTVVNPFDFFLEEAAERYPFAYDPALAADLVPYLRADQPGPLLEAWLAALPPLPPDGRATVDFLVSLNQAVQRSVAYTVRFEAGVQSTEVTLDKALGSCRDSAWLLVQVLRHHGLAARFVSGYLVQLTADVAALDGPSGPAADFTDLHAWAEVYLPGAGWVGLDATSGLFAGEGHLPLACTPEPSSAGPIEGAIEPCEVTMDYANRVTRVHEDPRVTKPYSSEQWVAIDALGAAIDARLDAGDVRLTMGGEPTFVSADDMESPQWTVDADGSDKRELAWQLTQRLAARQGPGLLVHHGQGKWYPGEPLPRWQIGLYWRRDGTPLWRDASLLADPWTPGAAIAAEGEVLAGTIATCLGVGAGKVLTAYEDPLAALVAQASLPAGPPPEVDPAGDELRLGPARERLIAHLDATVADPAGWVLPIAPEPTMPGAGMWRSVAWNLRRGRLVLLAGDSPIGLRLPLASLTWQPPPPVPERSTFDPRGELGDPAALAEAQAAAEAAAELLHPVEPLPPTALCVQVRDGRLHVFLPPLEYLEDAVGMLAAVESAAAEVGVAVVIEGYSPPRDPRLDCVIVAPDPGVIEVNVQPAGSWVELSAITTALYADAREGRLGTETFDLDGRHGGTGGGNHITLGGRTPADSPLLRRPDLLRSLVTYWQHHPSLSYLFSGRFVGPTSQAPRVDEGRIESLYELEIAFAEMDRLAGDGPAPWLVDRLLRNLLVDITGNTHRSEFCIDKLFSPDGERGRLGLVELRAFEMPPHAQMALVQALLVRAIVARCWEEPYRAPLMRWGGELHDRFLLAHYVQADIADVCADLREHGIEFQYGWLAPFFEFRFPRIGAVTVGDVTIELRSAIEPWLVLGEETTANSTARYVDSSVERLQVQVSGMTDGRHAVTCNGRAVPLRPTGVPGTTVAGVRYRAWQPPSALHPTIAVHSPLVFDLVDLWNGRSLGGCTYHVVHPGGRNYERFPVNANEAEARRVSRFEAIGHTPGPVDLTAWAPLSGSRGEYPRTLDLRWTAAARHP